MNTEGLISKLSNYVRERLFGLLNISPLLEKLNKEELIKKLRPYGQEHLVRFWEELTEKQRESLLEDINQIDLAELKRSYEKIAKEMKDPAKQLSKQIEPIPKESMGSFEKSSKEKLREYELEGLKAVASGSVAVLLLAGGQGTRLGANYPKGMYSVGLPSNKTLYQIQAERIIRLQQLANREFPEYSNSIIQWYIMTSEHTQESTIEFFKENSYFGLNKENIIFFDQFMLPCLSKDGKILLDQKYKISKAPDGNGGLYRALHKRHIIDDMKKKGIKHIHIYCVDNILVRTADPIFIGFCISKNANCAAKVSRICLSV
jgi:UDP-N-acetylglucosamine/UDP-N-acetylgalactosamine diphosphorylase